MRYDIDIAMDNHQVEYIDNQGKLQHYWQGILTKKIVLQNLGLGRELAADLLKNIRFFFFITGILHQTTVL